MLQCLRKAVNNSGSIAIEHYRAKSDAYSGQIPVPDGTNQLVKMIVGNHAIGMFGDIAIRLGHTVRDDCRDLTPYTQNDEIWKMLREKSCDNNSFRGWDKDHLAVRIALVRNEQTDNDEKLGRDLGELLKHYA